MSSKKNSHIIRWGVIAASFIIVALILWNTYDFFQKFKNEERTNMEVLAKAYERFSTLNDLNADMSLEDKDIGSNSNIPMTITDENDSITSWSNLDSLKINKVNFLTKQLAGMKSQNEPIIVSHQEGSRQFIYYRDSDLLIKLKYYPIALILILILFASVIYLFFKSNKIADSNKLWTGMARETAHQIGTPLSSLLGWVEILKLENTDENITNEIEQDVQRLNTIAERFSKIGSIPELKKANIVSATKDSFNYLKSRSSKQVEFSFNTSNELLFCNINLQLFSWVIENLVKNAIDAMDGKGSIALNIIDKENTITIAISDTGKGLSKKLFNQVFSPGFTTKKRGWGLGLSLAKRIINNYHNGKIYVSKSEIGKGTTFVIQLKKAL